MNSVSDRALAQLECKRSNDARTIILLLIRRGFVSHAYLCAPRQTQADEPKSSILHTELCDVQSELRTWTSATRELLLDAELAAERALDGNGGYAVTAICRMADEAVAHARLHQVLSNPLLDPRAVRISALIWALARGHVTVVKELLSHPRARGSHEPRMFMQTVRASKQLDFLCYFKITPLAVAICHPDSVKAAAMAHLVLSVPFFECGASVPFFSDGASHAIVIASIRNFVDVAERLLRIPCVARDRDALSVALDKAAEHGNARMCSLFVDHGVTPFPRAAQIAVLHASQSDACLQLARSFVLEREQTPATSHFFKDMAFSAMSKVLSVFMYTVAWPLVPPATAKAMLPCVQVLLDHPVWLCDAAVAVADTAWLSVPMSESYLEFMTFFLSHALHRETELTEAAQHLVRIFAPSRACAHWVQSGLKHKLFRELNARKAAALCTRRSLVLAAFNVVHCLMEQTHVLQAYKAFLLENRPEDVHEIRDVSVLLDKTMSS